MAYATEERASEDSTASPVTFDSRSRCAMSDGGCWPISARLMEPRVIGSARVVASAPDGGARVEAYRGPVSRFHQENRPWPETMARRIAAALRCRLTH